MKRGLQSLRGGQDSAAEGSLHGAVNWVRDSGRRRGLVARGGFGRIELLVVVAIILILFTMYWGPSASEKRKQVRLNCSNNLQKILIAMQIYATDNGGRFPVEPGARTAEEPLDKLVPKYTVDTPVFICPASRDDALPAGESIRQRKISYAYYMGRTAAEPDAVLMTDRQVDTQPKQTGQQVFSANGKRPGNNHEQRGGNFLFTDGHVDFIPPQVPFAIGLTQGVVLLNPKP